MTVLTPSPPVEHLRWGTIAVNNHGSFKDVKLFPGGAREWDWNETGTRHVPGIQPADVEELLEHAATAVILSSGMDQRLQVCAETLEYLESRDVTAHFLQTEKAVALYNHLRETTAVGALLHSTC